MKKCISLISVVMILFGLSGCFSFINRYSGNETMNQIYKTDKEVVAWTESQIIEALNAKNPELLMSVFSESALSCVNDLELGVEYLYEILDGEIIDISDSNYSATGYYNSGKKIRNISAWCNLTTATSTYKLSYVFYSINESDPEKEGVYRLNVCKTADPASASSNRYRIAGIDYPEREYAHVMADDIIRCIQEKNISELKGLFDDRVLEVVQDFDLGAQYSFDILTDSKIIGNHDSWIIREELGEYNVYQAYIAVETTKGDFMLIFEYRVGQMLADDVKLRTLMIKPMDIMSYSVNDLGKFPDRQGIYHPGWD